MLVPTAISSGIPYSSLFDIAVRDEARSVCWDSFGFPTVDSDAVVLSSNVVGIDGDHGGLLMIHRQFAVTMSHWVTS